MLYALSLISILGNYGHSLKLKAQVEAPHRKQGETRQLDHGINVSDGFAGQAADLGAPGGWPSSGRPRGSTDRSAEGGKLFTGHVARVIGRVQLDQYSVRVSELEAFF